MANALETRNVKKAGAEMPAPSSRRPRLMDTVDPERGNCLMLFDTKMDILNMMHEKEQCDTFILLKRWFEGEDESVVMQEAKEHPNDRQVATALRMLIADQKRHAGKFIDKCKKQQKRRMRKEKRDAAMEECNAFSVRPDYEGEDDRG